MIRRYLVSLAVLAAAAAPALAQPGMDRREGDRPDQREAMPRERGPEMERGERGPRGPMVRERLRERREAIRERGDRLERDDRPQARRERRHPHRDRMHDRRGGPEGRFGRAMGPVPRERLHRPFPHRRGPMARGGEAGRACPHCGGPLGPPEARLHRDRDARQMGPAGPRGQFRGLARPHGRGHAPDQGHEGMGGPRLKDGDRFEGRFRRPMGPMRRGPVDGRPL